MIPEWQQDREPWRYDAHVETGEILDEKRVYDPFGGIGTVPVRALKLGRKGRGVEWCRDCSQLAQNGVIQ